MVKVLQLQDDHLNQWDLLVANHPLELRMWRNTCFTKVHQTCIQQANAHHFLSLQKNPRDMLQSFHAIYRNHMKKMFKSPLTLKFATSDEDLIPFFKHLFSDSKPHGTSSYSVSFLSMFVERILPAWKVEYYFCFMR